MMAEVRRTGNRSPPLVRRGAERENQLMSTMAPKLAASKAQTSRVASKKRRLIEWSLPTRKFFRSV